jgi:hypothetical protein
VAETGTDTSIDEVVRNACPLTTHCLEPLKSAATKPLRETGTDTSIDEVVRNAWQIEASKVSFDEGTLWSDYLASGVRQACNELGFSDGRFREL